MGRLRKARPPKSRTELESRTQKRIRYLRKSAGLTLAELAEQADLSIDALSRIESGQRSPTLNTLASLAGALHIPITDLFEKDDPKVSPLSRRLLQLFESQPPIVRRALIELVEATLQLSSAKPLRPR